MANIKLKDHYWETEGVYDAALSKTQKAINADIAEVAQNNSDLIIMSSTQPTATGNKIWIKEGVSYQIPVMDDLISNNITNNSSVTGTKVTDALNTLGTNVSSLQGSLNAVCLRAAVKTISGNGTSSNTLTGLTADHVVGNWGMFSDANCTTPIPENSPPCDITITTAANAWSVTIANYSSTFYLRPTFILKQN